MILILELQFLVLILCSILLETMKKLNNYVHGPCPQDICSFVSGDKTFTQIRNQMRISSSNI